MTHQNFSSLSSQIPGMGIEFDVAFDLLDRDDTLEARDGEYARQSFYNRPGNCQKHIQAALRQIS